MKTVLLPHFLVLSLAMPFVLEETFAEDSKISETSAQSQGKKASRRWRLSRKLKKIYDKDLIPLHELPPNTFISTTKRGYRNVDTGELYDRKWLEEKKAREKKSGRS